MALTLPTSGVSAADLLRELDEMAVKDVDWKHGRAFSLAYFAGDDVLQIGQQAYQHFMSANALNMDAFPSLRRMHGEVVNMVSELLHGGAAAAGFMTSGGTESILMAVKAARERGKHERKISAPEMVLPTTAHAAFEKAAYYFGVRSIRVPVGEDFRANSKAMANAMTSNTVLLVASAPSYPQGVIDPVREIGSLAESTGCSFHVDACMGGITLPFAERLGRKVRLWDFRVPGVTSISVDLHKYGYTPKGASVIVHRNKNLRRYQTFTTDEWLGGLYGSPSVLGTRSGGPIAGAWAVLRHLGEEGYLRLTKAALDAAAALRAGIEQIPELIVRGNPDATLLAFGAANPARLDVFAVADALWNRGWYVDRQMPPPSLHATVNAVHEGVIEPFLADLRACVATALEEPPAPSSGGAYATVE